MDKTAQKNNKKSLTLKQWMVLQRTVEQFP